MPLLSSPRFAFAAVLLGAAVLAGPAAHAFTIQTESANGNDQSFLYPDKTPGDDSGQSQGFTEKDGITTYKEGSTTLQFGHRQSFDQRYNADQLFDPLGHPPGVR